MNRDSWLLEMLRISDGLVLIPKQDIYTFTLCTRRLSKHCRRGSGKNTGTRREKNHFSKLEIGKDMTGILQTIWNCREAIFSASQGNHLICQTVQERFCDSHFTNKKTKARERRHLKSHCLQGTEPGFEYLPVPPQE